MIEPNGAIVQKQTWMPGREKKGTEDYRLSSIYSLREIYVLFRGYNRLNWKGYGGKQGYH